MWAGFFHLRCLELQNITSNKNIENTRTLCKMASNNNGENFKAKMLAVKPEERAQELQKREERLQALREQMELVRQLHARRRLIQRRLAELRREIAEGKENEL